MDLVNRDKNAGMEAPPVWAEYQGIIDQAEGRRCEMTKIERSVNSPPRLGYIVLISGSSFTNRQRRVLWWCTQGRLHCTETSFCRKAS